MSNNEVIQVSDLAFRYGTTSILDGVDFRVSTGELVALVGPNGSGKSTLIRLLLGLLRRERGAVKLFDTEPSQLQHRWRVGYVPQRAVLDQYLPATVNEVVSAGRLARRGAFRRFGPDDRLAVREAMAAVALEPLADRRVQQLSGGQQQRVLIAKALASRPELLILDEPTTGVDTESQKLFRDALVTIRDAGAAVLLVSHELSAVAEDLDRILLMRQGRIDFDGPPEAFVERGVSLGVHAADLPFWLEGTK